MQRKIERNQTQPERNLVPLSLGTSSQLTGSGTTQPGQVSTQPSAQLVSCSAQPTGSAGWTPRSFSKSPTDDLAKSEDNLQKV